MSMSIVPAYRSSKGNANSTPSNAQDVGSVCLLLARGNNPFKTILIKDKLTEGYNASKGTKALGIFKSGDHNKNKCDFIKAVLNHVLENTKKGGVVNQELSDLIRSLAPNNFELSKHIDAIATAILRAVANEEKSTYAGLTLSRADSFSSIPEMPAVKQVIPSDPPPSYDSLFSDPATGSLILKNPNEDDRLSPSDRSEKKHSEIQTDYVNLSGLSRDQRLDLLASKLQGLADMGDRYEIFGSMQKELQKLGEDVTHFIDNGFRITDSIEPLTGSVSTGVTTLSNEAKRFSPIEAQDSNAGGVSPTIVGVTYESVKLSETGRVSPSSETKAAEKTYFDMTIGERRGYRDKFAGEIFSEMSTKKNPEEKIDVLEQGLEVFLGKLDGLQDKDKVEALVAVRKKIEDCDRKFHKHWNSSLDSEQTAARLAVRMSTNPQRSDMLFQNGLLLFESKVERCIEFKPYNKVSKEQKETFMTEFKGNIEFYY